SFSISSCSMVLSLTCIKNSFLYGYRRPLGGQSVALLGTAEGDDAAALDNAAVCTRWNPGSKPAGASSGHQQVHEIAHRHGFQPRLVQRHVEDALLALGVETSREVAAELFLQQRQALVAAARMADGVFHQHLVQRAAVPEVDGQAIGDT